MFSEIDAETVEALRAHREAQLLQRTVVGEAYFDHDLVFADEVGAPIYPQRLTEAFLRHRKAAGLTSGSLHVLRHTHATLALTNGVHVVAARIGDRPETVLRVYAHLPPQSDVEAAEQGVLALSSPGHVMGDLHAEERAADRADRARAKEERGKAIYEAAVDGESWEAIAAAHGYSTASGAYSAARTYAECHGLELPRRSRGRPRKSEGS
jgi:hypothetical protein